MKPASIRRASRGERARHELGLSRERIRQIAKIALGRLAQAAGPERLEELLA